MIEVRETIYYSQIIVEIDRQEPLLWGERLLKLVSRNKPSVFHCMDLWSCGAPGQGVARKSSYSLVPKGSFFLRIPFFFASIPSGHCGSVPSV